MLISMPELVLQHAISGQSYFEVLKRLMTWRDDQVVTESQKDSLEKVLSKLEEQCGLLTVDYAMLVIRASHFPLYSVELCIYGENKEKSLAVLSFDPMTVYFGQRCWNADLQCSTKGDEFDCLNDNLSSTVLSILSKKIFKACKALKSSEQQDPC